jgi:hypothetical protein
LRYDELLERRGLSSDEPDDDVSSPRRVSDWCAVLGAVTVIEDLEAVQGEGQEEGFGAEDVEAVAEDPVHVRHEHVDPSRAYHPEGVLDAPPSVEYVLERADVDEGAIALVFGFGLPSKARRRQRSARTAFFHFDPSGSLDHGSK